MSFHSDSATETLQCADSLICCHRIYERAVASVVTTTGTGSELFADPVFRVRLHPLYRLFIDVRFEDAAIVWFRGFGQLRTIVETTALDQLLNQSGDIR